MGSFIDLKHQKIGYLTPLEYIPGDRKTLGVWICQCVCGNIKPIKACKLTTKRCKSCGCMKYDMISDSLSKGYGKITGRYWGKVCDSAQKRNIPLSITIQDAWLQFERQTGLCALSGQTLLFHKILTIQTASLDRRDSGLGYSLDNIQWIHKELNQIKSSMDESKFVAWCGKVADWRIHRNEQS